MGRIVESRAALLLDRDGVLNVDEGYSYDPATLRWIPGARAAVKAANDAGVAVLVVTNQSGIGRGYYTEAQMHTFHAAIQAGLGEVGARVDAFYFCPFHEDAVEERYRVADHPNRKPNPGMLHLALRDWGVAPSRAIMIGDKPSDMLAAERAGVEGVLFVGGDLMAVVGPLLHRLNPES